MKNKCKIIAIVSILLAGLLIGKARAQIAGAGKLQGSVGLEINDPTGNARIGSHFSLGGTVMLQYGLSNSFAVIATSGAYHFFPTIIPGTNKRYDSYGVIPVEAGVKWFFVPNIYVSGQAGIGREATDSGYGPNRLMLTPALGYATRHWDFGVHYDNFSSPGGDHYGLLGVRLAYAFGL